LKGQNFAAAEDFNPIKRDSAVKLLKNQIIPTQKSLSQFGLVYGENGTSKTTTLRQVAQDAKKGVVFVKFEVTDQQIGQAIADPFGVRSKYDALSWLDPIAEAFGVLPKLSDPAQLLHDELMITINKGAEKYKEANDGVPPVLIIDNVDRLVKLPGGKEALIKLMIWAKDCAVSGSFFLCRSDLTWLYYCQDNNRMMIVFIASEGPTVDMMKNQSAASRMKWIELSDMTDAEASDFLKTNLKEDCRQAFEKDEQATKVLAVTIHSVIGGRALLLASLANALNAIQAPDAGKHDFCAAIAGTFENSQPCFIC
jgi:Cdc6-like AAA superfamily ATPase